MRNGEKFMRVLRKYWVILASIGIVLAASLKILWHRNLSRAAVNAISYTMGKHLLRLVKAHYTVVAPHGISFKEGHPYIIMSNHASHYDIPLIFVAFKNHSVRMLAKRELFKVPIWGKAMLTSEFLSIDRDNRQQALQDLQIAKEKMQSGIILWIAPEGTRSRTGKLGPFKKGGFKLAMQTGATIIPVAIVGSAKILPPKTLQFNFNAQVAVHIAPPIEAANYQDLATLMQDVTLAIKQAGNLE